MFAVGYDDGEVTSPEIHLFLNEVRRAVDPDKTPVPARPGDDEVTGKQCRKCWRRVEDCVCGGRK